MVLVSCGGPIPPALRRPTPAPFEKATGFRIHSRHSQLHDTTARQTVISFSATRLGRRRTIQITRRSTKHAVLPSRSTLEFRIDGLRQRDNPALHRRVTGLALFASGDSSRPWLSVS